MSNKGWIKLHRKVFNSSIFDNPDLFKMWMWCLLKASHTGYKQMVGLEEVELKEGQFITGRNKGSLELNVKPTTWYKHLKVLESMGMIELESNNKMTIVTVVNWRLYQGEDLEKEQPKNNKGTTKEQQRNTNKNVKNAKNVKNDKNIVATSATAFKEDSPEYWLSEYLYQKIKDNDPKARKPNLQSWAVHIDRLIRIDKREPKQIMQVINWATSDDFWKSNILSTNKLRQKYQTLYLQMQRGGSNKKAFPVYTDKDRQAIEEFLNG